jgi:hypothetical protein
MTAEDADLQRSDLDPLLSESDDDKTYAAMGVAKTIGTVRFFPPALECKVDSVAGCFCG